MHKKDINSTWSGIQYKKNRKIDWSHIFSRSFHNCLWDLFGAHFYLHKIPYSSSLIVRTNVEEEKKTYIVVSIRMCIWSTFFSVHFLFRVCKTFELATKNRKPLKLMRNFSWNFSEFLSCRKVLNIMVIMGFMLNYALRVNLTIAIVAMVDDQMDNKTTNLTSKHEHNNTNSYMTHSNEDLTSASHTLPNTTAAEPFQHPNDKVSMKWNRKNRSFFSEIRIEVYF